jgi:protocatechuate 3,4-dioxygenase beta subunit
MSKSPIFDEDNDDEAKGRILSRREALALLGISSVSVIAGCAPGTRTSAPTSTITPAPAPATDAPVVEPTQAQATAVPVVPTEAPTLVATDAPTLGPTATAETVIALPACVVSPQMTEGPYFVDEKLNRSDIRANTSDGAVSEGAPFKLTIRASGIGNGTCTPLQGAWIDIWHCDALGIYSAVSDRFANSVGQNFLRGYQVTDANGTVTFTTIFPGWYQGRAVHIHFKVRNDPSVVQGFEFTSQFFFPQNICDEVFTSAPYTTKGTGYLRNERDNIYNSGGSQTTLLPVREGEGYAATFDIGVQI